MKINKNQLPKSQMEFVVELSFNELEPFTEWAVEEISKHRKIAGFRPGKAPYEIIVREVGEMFIYQTAANEAAEATLSKILDEEKLEIVGQPKIEVQKLAPNNDFIYKATITLLPNVAACDISKIKIKPMQKIVVEEKEIEKTLDELRRLRAKEILEDKPASKGDKVEIEFKTFIDGVAIEGDKAKKHAVYIGEGAMIPGFEDNLVGLKNGDEKTFELAFPKNYHQKNLADKKGIFKVKAAAVFRVELPELNDEFAKSLGLKTFADLEKNILDNIKREKELKEMQRFELEIIDALIEKSSFGELPDILIDDEAHKMVHELEDNLTRQGMNFDDYLSHLKKTEADLCLGFAPEAIKRVKTALVMRAIAKNEGLGAAADEVEQEIERTITSYKLHPAYENQVQELEQNIRSKNAQRYFENVIINRKTMELIKNKITAK